jgi:hypothetical protein
MQMIPWLLRLDRNAAAGRLEHENDSFGLWALVFGLWALVFGLWAPFLKERAARVSGNNDLVAPIRGKLSSSRRFP